MAHEIIVWDLETVPDIDGYAKANGLVGKSPSEIRLAMGDNFPKLIERELIGSFVQTIEQLTPRMVTFNGCSFDLPVLRYRAMIHEISAPGLDDRSYFHRYTDNNADLCDVLSSFSYGGKAKLDELSRIMGLEGKPAGIDGSQVEAFCNAGRIQEIADYCLSDVINTYRLWLRYELFRGRLDKNQFRWSELDIGGPLN